jgi:hypothetical protein
MSPRNAASRPPSGAAGSRISISPNRLLKNSEYPKFRSHYSVQLASESENLQLERCNGFCFGLQKLVAEFFSSLLKGHGFGGVVAVGVPALLGLELPLLQPMEVTSPMAITRVRSVFTGQSFRQCGTIDTNSDPATGQ